MDLLHFYREPSAPFRSITELSDEEALLAMAGMGDAASWCPARFEPERRQRYLAARRRSERQLRESFISQGGRPTRETPYYLMVATPETERLWPAAARVRVPLAEMPQGQGQLYLPRQHGL